MRVPVEIISLLLVLLAKSVLGANVACQEVRYKYSAKGNAADLYDMPLTPPSSGKQKNHQFFQTFWHELDMH